MEMTLMTSTQRRKFAGNNRKIQQIREIIGFTVEVGPKEERHKGKRGELIGWRYNEKGEVEYVIRLYSNDQCIFVSDEKFRNYGYVFIG